MVRAQANRRIIQPVVEPFSMPVFRLLQDGEPDYWCTGFFLQFDDTVIFVTAGHSLGSIRPHVFTKTGSCRELIGTPVFGKDTLLYGDPIDDIVTLRLSPAEAAVIDAHRVVPMSAIAPFEYRNENFSPYMIMGVQASEQRMQHEKKNWQFAQTSLMIGAADPNFYVTTRLDRSRVLLLNAHQSTYRSAKGSGGVPRLNGMSGAPVWRYNPEEPYSVQYPPPLVGLFIGKPSSTRKVAMAIRMGPILEHIRIAYEDVARLLPKYPSSTS